MKKVLFLFCLLVSSFAFGQNSNSSKVLGEVYFYGVDFSSARVYGAAETPEQFKKMYTDLNLLFISEAKKYDVAKHLNIDVAKVDLTAVNEVNKQVNPSEIISNTTNYAFDGNTIEAKIKMLPIKDQKGTGLVIVAELLNKAASQGTYQYVYFDIESRKIISSCVLSGKAGGFGLRNFWAASIYKTLKTTSPCSK